jgi:hypothetical protein
MAECKACKERGKTWDGSAPQCAFVQDGIFTGVFNSDNWNCATMNKLRNLCDEPINNEDQNAEIICGVDSQHVVLTWYKRRGRTEGAFMLNDGVAMPLVITEAENIIDKNKVAAMGAQYIGVGLHYSEVLNAVKESTWGEERDDA